MTRPLVVPTYSLHKATGQTRVRLDGRDHYLSLYGSAQSRQKYARLIAEHVRPGAGTASPLPPAGDFPDLSINEFFVRYLEFADTYYLRDGIPAGETKNMKDAMRSVRALYEATPAGEFGPLALKAVRHYMINVEKLSRKVVNSRVNKVRRIFKWAVSEELVPPSTYEALRAVDGLRAGRSNARETDPVRSVHSGWVEGIKRFLAPQVADMVEVARLTSMRPGDLVLALSQDQQCDGTS